MAQEDRVRGAAPRQEHGGKTGASHEAREGHVGEEGHRIVAGNLTPEDERFLAEHGDQLSRSTLRAKWIPSPDEHEDHPGQSLATRGHEVIQRWAEERGAQPATVPGTEHGGRPGVLRFDFPGYGGQALEIIGWDDWFRGFDERQLVFVFQEHKSDGHVSNFFRLDSPERGDA